MKVPQSDWHLNCTQNNDKNNITFNYLNHEVKVSIKRMFNFPTQTSLSSICFKESLECDGKDLKL